MRQRFIQSFSTSGTEHEAIDAERLGKPYVAYIEDGQYIDWNTLWPTPPVPPEPVYSAMPLTFQIISGGTVEWHTDDSAFTTSIEYKINDGNWTTITNAAKNNKASFVVEDGDTVQFRGDNATYSSGDTNTFFRGNDLIFTIEGNIMSLIDSTGFTTATTLYSSNTFQNMFNFNNSVLLSAENLILPATSLTENCYKFMLGGNSGMTAGPVLPAPVLVNGCYTGLFQGCGSLKTIKCLARNYNNKATISWVNRISATGTFIKHPNATWPTGSNGAPTGWTVINASI